MLPRARARFRFVREEVLDAVVLRHGVGLVIRVQLQPQVGVFASKSFLVHFSGLDLFLHPQPILLRHVERFIYRIELA